MKPIDTIAIRSDLVRVLREGAESVGSGFTEPDDDWMFLMMGRTEEEGIIIGVDPEMFATEESKDILADALADLAQSQGFVAYGLVMSMWYVALEKKVGGTAESYDAYRRRGGPPPSEHPDRKEGLLIMGADRFGEEAYTADIIRRDDGPPMLAEWKPMPGDATTGRFVEPFRKALRHQG